jgi:urease accessory protein
MHSIVLDPSERIFAGNRAHGRIRLAVESNGSATRRKRVHESGSLRVRFPSAASDELEAVLVNTAGGMTGGDAFEIDIAVGTHAHLTVTSAAAEKVYRSLGPRTSIDIRLDVAPGGALTWIPQETILFNAANLTRSIEVDLAEHARLLLVEPVVFGRAGMGEVVTQGALHERWRVRRDGRLIYADGVALAGAIAETLARPAVAAGRHALATLLLIPGDEAGAGTVRALADLRGEVGISTWNGITLARFCAPDGSALRHDLMAVLACLRAAPLPRLWTN